MKRYIKASKSTKKVNVNTLKQRLQKAVESYADKIGLDSYYTRVDITDTDDSVDIEIGMEADFDELYELCTILDKIIVKYDSNAYFENEEPGIITARIQK